MRLFHIDGDRFAELPGLPDSLPATGYCWLAAVRGDVRAQLGELQGALQRWTGAQLVDLHVSDLLNDQLPSTYDYTSWYDILVFRRLAAPLAPTGEAGEPPLGRGAPAGIAVQALDTNAVGFALFDRLLLTVHPSHCVVREFFANRLQNQMPATDLRSAARTPPSPADLMLRMVNFMVDGYLELRRVLARQLDAQQQALFDPQGGFVSWQTLLASRNALHLLEDTCEDQRSAIAAWLDTLDESPPPDNPALGRERELLQVRSRDVLEHIERVLSHVRRLEASTETAVQMHFSAQSHRTNDIMRTLTVLTAIFLPLNLITGFFGMNFEKLPLIHSPRGFWIATVLLLGIAAAMSAYFWRKRYIGRTP